MRTICKANRDLWWIGWIPQFMIISLWIGDIDYGNSIVVIWYGVRDEESRALNLFSITPFKLCEPIDTGQLRFSNSKSMLNAPRSRQRGEARHVRSWNCLEYFFAFSFCLRRALRSPTFTIRVVSILSPFRDRHNLTATS